MCESAVSSSRNGSNYNVRICNRKTADRTLLKGFNGRVIDIAFAFASSVVLGIVDEVGGIFVYDITEMSDGKIAYPFCTICVSKVLHKNSPVEAFMPLQITQ